VSVAARTLRVALCQIGAAAQDATAARARSFDAADEAFGRGASVVLLPELIVPGYGSEPERMASFAEALEGPTVGGWVEIARRHGGLVAGGLCERDGDAVYNSAVLVDGHGIVLHYRKLHLFGAEKHAFTPGDRGLPVADTAAGRIGLCVCYDLRFVEVIRILALRGAELVLVPTAWIGGFDREGGAEVAPQVPGVVVQANLSQVFIACASHAGEHGGTRFLGSSLLADPHGAIACGPLGADGDATVLAEIDLAEARRAQRRGELITPRADRRTDLYGVAVDGELL